MCAQDAVDFYEWAQSDPMVSLSLFLSLSLSLSLSCSPALACFASVVVCVRARMCPLLSLSVCLSGRCNHALELGWLCILQRLALDAAAHLLHG